jgi:hypothetical protein
LYPISIPEQATNVPKNIFSTFELFARQQRLNGAGVITGSLVHYKKGSRMTFRHKVGAAIGALALVAGAVPGAVTSASAYENPKGGQHMDRGRFPRKIHIVMILTVTAIVAAVLLTKNDDRPTSP